MKSAQVLSAVRQLMQAVAALEQLYPGRSFTLDGHLIGSIGEVLAAEMYGLTLHPASVQCHDAVCPLNRDVQIKLTQTNRVSIYSQPDYLLVLRIDHKTGVIEEVYNGPGEEPWARAGKMQKNGQRPISVAKLRTLARAVESHDRLGLATRPEWLKAVG